PWPGSKPGQRATRAKTNERQKAREDLAPVTHRRPRGTPPPPLFDKRLVEIVEQRLAKIRRRDPPGEAPREPRRVHRRRPVDGTLRHMRRVVSRSRRSQ